MAEPRSSNIRELPGDLVINPTDLTVPSPYGGTKLGEVRAKIFRFGIKTTMSTAEELGNITVEGRYVGEAAIFAAILREFDADAIETIFPNTPVGQAGRDPVIEFDPTEVGLEPGLKLSTSAVKLLFVPRAIEEHEHVLLYLAMPAIEETAELRCAFQQEIGIAVFFVGIPSAAAGMKVYQIGKRTEISLT